MAPATGRLARAAAAAALAFACCGAMAQAITANGLGTTASAAGSNWTIGGGTQVGGNLFHSFGRFNIDSGGSATFTGPASVGHIVSRVTGGERSMIDGRFASSIPGASVWFINPAGVTFGANASLDVKGSFHASSADYVQVGALRFNSATPVSSLVSAQPSAFGFLSASAASIAVNGATLSVPALKDLSLVGGDVTLTGATLRAPGGDIVVRGGELAISGGTLNTRSSVAGRNAGAITLEAAGGLTIAGGAKLTSEAIADGDAGSLSLVADYISISGQSTIDAGTKANATGNGAALTLRATGDITLDGFSNASSASFGAGKAGTVTISARDLILNHGWVIADGYVAGDAGSVTVDARNVTLTDYATLSAGTGVDSTGRGGLVTVRASGEVSVSGSYTAISSATYGSGAGGDVVIDAGSVLVQDHGEIGSAIYGTGTGGNVSISARGTVKVTGINTSISSYAYQGAGKGGNISIQAADVVVENGGHINSGSSDSPAGNIDIRADRVLVSGSGQIESSTFDARGGNISIDARESVTVTGIVSKIVATTSGDGPAGNISIRAPLLTVADSAAIDTSSALGTGAAGNITINAGRVLVSDATIASETSGAGPGGKVRIDAAESITVTAGGRVKGETSDVGNGGAIVLTAPDVIFDNGFANVGTSFGTDSGAPGTLTINAARLLVTNASFIDSDNFGALSGGGITVNASESATVSGKSTISSSTLGEARGGTVAVNTPLLVLDDGYLAAATGIPYWVSHGRGGDVIVNAGTVRVGNGGGMFAQSEGRGRGGKITVNAGESLTLDATGILFSGTYAKGRAGDIEVNTPRLTLAGGAISSQTVSSGAGGDIALRAGTILVTDGGVISASSFDGSGNAGVVNIQTTDLTLSGTDSRGFSSAVASIATGSGKGGAINIEASRKVELLDGGFIATSAQSRDGGNITMTIGELLHLRKSEISTSVGTDRGNGGNITIDPVFVLLEDSRIVANAFQGSGGNISIISQFFLTQGDWLVQASSEKGISGNVVISSPRVDLAGSLRVLPTNYLDASSQLRAGCGVSAGNSFVASGRGGLAEVPLHVATPSRPVALARCP